MSSDMPSSQCSDVVLNYVTPVNVNGDNYKSTAIFKKTDSLKLRTMHFQKEEEKKQRHTMSRIKKQKISSKKCTQYLELASHLNQTISDRSASRFDSTFSRMLTITPLGESSRETKLKPYLPSA